MANNWNIPAELEVEVRLRDTVCVYCGSEFSSHRNNRKKVASWEHIINDASIINVDNIALCCCGCNASKGQKRLSEWLQSEYCIKNGINYAQVAPIIEKALDRGL
jgi:5-methylcytosine-specific restriction endonuclease McrA